MTSNSNVLSSQLSSSTSAIRTSPLNRSFLLRSIDKRRTIIIFVIILATTMILVSSWNLFNSILSWYACALTMSSSSLFWWPTICASMALGVIFGVLSMAATLAVVVPATMLTWICVIVFLSFSGTPRKLVVMEGKKLRDEMSRKVGMLMIKEGNLVAIVCALFGYSVYFTC
ncbi:uncharacterized protein [Rutidosis leptorrhynchoides]|uniref:uncharacterized protein n=1 Tax=Rutidosis leptorrhynchoides TaxID=125765 RepID=UPI003A993906